MKTDRLARWDSRNAVAALKLWRALDDMPSDARTYRVMERRAREARDVVLAQSVGTDAVIADLVAALQWIADHGDTGSMGRPAFYDMRDHARTAIRKAKGAV